MKKKMLLNTVTSLVGQLVAIIYGFILPRLMLEYFGSELNGLTQSINQFLGVVGFMDLGVGQVVRSALYRPLGEKDNDQISRIMVSGSKFYRRIAYALVGYVVILIFVYPYLVDQDYGWAYTAGMIVVMAISTFAQYYFGIANEQLLHADQRGYVIYSLQILSHLINTLVCVWMLRKGCSIHAVKLASSVVFLIRPAVINLYIRAHYRLDKKITYDEEPVKQKWNGIAQHIAAVVLAGTDTIVLTLFSTLSNVSVYSVYYMVLSSIQSFYHAVTAGIQSAAGAMWVKGDKKSLDEMFSNTEVGLHMVSVFVFSCVAMLLVPFVKVYTNGLMDAEYIQPLFAIILTLAYGIRCLRTPYNIWILAAGHYKQTQRCHIVAAVLNLAISIVGVICWGLVGVALGTLIAMLYQTLWMAVYNTKHLLKRPLRSVVKQMGVDVITFGLIWLATCWISMPEVSYLGWFLMALPVGVIALTVTVAMALLFYRQRLIGMVQWFVRKRNKE